jgi:hypothetical protein
MNLLYHLEVVAETGFPSFEKMHWMNPTLRPKHKGWPLLKNYSLDKVFEYLKIFFEG